MRHLYFIMVAIAFVGSETFAKVETSQTLMPEAGQADLQFGVGYGKSTGKFVGGKMDSFVTSLGASLGYGIGEGHLLSAGLGFQSQSTEGTTYGVTSEESRSGLRALTLNYVGRADANTASFYYGLGYTIPAEESTINGSDVAPEQSVISLGVGGVVDVFPLNVGGFLSYDHHLKGKVKGTSGDIHVEGGDSVTLQGFVEFQNPYHTNFSVAYTSMQGDKRTDFSGSFDNEDVGLLTLTMSLRVELRPNLQILPAVSYVNVIQKPDALESSNGYGVNIALRSLL